MEKKLELSQLKNYLGTGLKVMIGSTVTEITAVSTDSPFIFINSWLGSRQKQMVNIENIKPLMYRLSDLDKMIPELGFVPLDELEKGLDFTYKSAFHHLTVKPEDIENVSFWAIKKLTKWHFWVFDQSYFEKGLIIDKLKQS